MRTVTGALLSLLASTILVAQGSPPPGATPLDALPAHVRVLVKWGQRPAWSHDGRYVLFMEKAFGDAYRVDVATGELQPLTTHYPNKGYNRVLQLSNGDYLLTGNSDFDVKDPWKNRHHMEMWVLDRRLDRPAVHLDAAIDEGPAVSRRSPRIAWTAPGQREMFMADVEYTGGTPALANIRRILSYDADGQPQTMRLETQDFRPPDERELLFTCYSGTEQEPFYFADVCGLDLAGGAVRNYTHTPETYDEAEGVFPDGQSILVESDRHTRNREWRIDLYRVPLDGTNDGGRLTRFSGPPDTPYHGSDGVVSPDGRFMAFQLGVRGPQAGQGRGILLMDLQPSR